MFTFMGDTVLDPFLGSGTTMKVALELERNGVGYEVNESYWKQITEKMELSGELSSYGDIQLIKRDKEIANLPDIGYIPSIQDASPPLADGEMDYSQKNLRKVSDIVDERTIKLDTGQEVGFLGVKIPRKDAALEYLRHKVLGKKIILGYDAGIDADIAEKKEKIEAYVYLANRLFINGYLIKAGLGIPDQEMMHRMQDKFRKWAGEGD